MQKTENQLNLFERLGHAAKYENSARLQAVIEILKDGKEHTSRELATATGSVAIAQDINELRHPLNGFKIDCEFRGKTPAGRNIFSYKLEGREN